MVRLRGGALAACTVINGQHSGSATPSLPAHQQASSWAPTCHRCHERLVDAGAHKCGVVDGEAQHGGRHECQLELRAAGHGGQAVQGVWTKRLAKEPCQAEGQHAAHRRFSYQGGEASPAAEHAGPRQQPPPTCGLHSRG